MRKKGEKTSFVMRYDWNEDFKQLTDSEYREMLEGIYQYAKTRVKPSFSSRLLELLFLPVMRQLDEDYESWLDTCKRKSDAKKSYWDNKKEQEAQDNTTVYKSIDDDTTVYNCNSTIQDVKDNSDSDYDNDLYSVCNINNTRTCNLNKTNLQCNTGEKEFSCHLGATEKEESCADCMKKNICPFAESSRFLLLHQEGFEKWIEKRKKVSEEFINRSCDKSSDMAILDDYNYLGD